MKPRRPLKILFYLNLLIMLGLLGYKAYLNYFLPDFAAEHQVQLDQLEARLGENPQAFSFALVGNINNSIGIFEKQLIPHINASDADFMISAGNAVSGGGEDKYQSLYGSLQQLNIPYLLTFGEQEQENFGSYRFYEHFGPHYFSFLLGDYRFTFLDTTGKTPWQWQLRWLQDLLKEQEAKEHFLFTGRPLFAEDEGLLAEAPNLLEPAPFRLNLLDILDENDIHWVFSAQKRGFHQQQLDSTLFLATGGAGGVLLEDDYYHYWLVHVSPEGVSLEQKKLATGQHPFFRTLESLWSFIYSLFYVSYLNFILLVCLFSLLAIKLHALIFKDRNYYPNYDLDPTPWINQPLRIAMFTNNYLPFIGGVPLSIQRLQQGLSKLGNKLLIVAPRYPNQPHGETQVVRVPSLFTLGAKSEFRLANIFSLRVFKRVRAFVPDLIHVHHPFWLGSLGVFIARRLRVPAVYTYHTRLEHYAHFVPLPGLLFRNLISHVLVRRFANRCDAVIVPTYSTEEYLRMIGVKRPTYVQPTGIDFERFQTVDQDAVEKLRQRLQLGQEKILISVARLSNEKNIDFMIDALAELKKKTTQPFRLLMLGDGHQRKRLQKRLDELQLNDCITLVGAVPPDEMPLWYHLGDLFVFASKSETQGMVILEAMAAGLPVVAVRSSGIDDVVQDDHNGYKTPERLDLWLARVQTLLEDQDKHQELAEKALKTASQHSVEVFSKKVKAIYSEVLAAKQSRQ
ncbi:glycosyltransferase [Marinospirillum perlucidum]|uniref:glycosyltransferase n=1 Tax=Marinospirillum perlucidum TaxID=1982602 RepID=UPI000DF407CC|nr:glycosyltransferase [Marinospirillum perlucidum]